MPSFTNQDGLTIKYGLDRALEQNEGTTSYHNVRQLMVYVDSQSPLTAAGVDELRPWLPEGAVVMDSVLVADTAWTGTGTLDIGLAEADGTVIDEDGLDAAIDVDSALASAGDVVLLDGVLADKSQTTGSVRSFVTTDVNGSITAGTGWLYVNYLATR